MGPPRPSKRPADSSEGPPAKRSKGFRVGPGRAQGRYTGHADAIKATLIHKAHVKKAYAKTLQREGYANTTEQGQSEQAERPTASASHPSFAPPPISSTAKEPSTPPSKRQKPSRKGKERAVELPRFVQPKQPRALPPPRPKQPEKPRRKTPEEIEALKQRRQEDNSKWHRRRSDGKIDQASRIGVLLGKIERKMEDGV